MLLIKEVVLTYSQNIKVKFQDDPTEVPWKNCNVAVLGGMPILANITSYNNIQFINGNLRIPSLVLRQFYQPVLDRTAQHVKELLENPACKSLKYIFLVGGFSESPLLLKAIQNKIGRDITIISPPRPATSVLIGAIKYGFDQKIISSRIAVRTIGVEMVKIWDEAVHKGRKILIANDGKKYCEEIFRTFVRVNEPIKTNHEVLHTLFPIYDGQSLMTIPVLSSIKANVPYCRDPGVNLMGNLTLQMPEHELSNDLRPVDIKMKFGGTVFSVTATYRRTGESVNSQFNFLLGILFLFFNVCIILILSLYSR